MLWGDSQETVPLEGKEDEMAKTIPKAQIDWDNNQLKRVLWCDETL